MILDERNARQQLVEVPCAINTIDVGIAVGSACAMASDLRLDTRVMHSAGMAAMNLGWPCVDAKNVLALPLSCKSKNPFFDRQTTRQPNAELRKYIESEILPRYRNADGSKIRISTDMAYAIAAYHDTGLAESRETHHVASARIIREDKHLLQWFTPEQIEVMAQAAEDHRASSKSEPRSIYGRIVAEADRAIDPESIIRRTVQYGLSHYPELDKEGHYRRTLDHMAEKYAEGGYLKLWIAESPNGERLAQLRAIIRDSEQMRQVFEQQWMELA